jgi:hypothetical protein
MTPSTIDVPPSASPSVARAITTARKLIAGATSENTRRSYATGWRQFSAHTNGLGLEPLGAHPALVVTFLGHLRDGGALAQTLGSRAAAIRFFIGKQGWRRRPISEWSAICLRAPAGKTPAAITAEPPLPRNGLPRRSSSRGRRPGHSPSANAPSCCRPLPRGGGGRRSLDSTSRTSTSAGRASSSSPFRKSKTDQCGAGQFVAVQRLETGHARSRQLRRGW